MPMRIAIIGRPNVGKSTLFNRLVGKRLAIVDDQPGVTRDLREGDARLFDLRFTVVDTAGLEEANDDSLQGRMRRLTERAVENADLSLFMIDARAGIIGPDRAFSELLRRSGAQVAHEAQQARNFEPEIEIAVDEDDAAEGPRPITVKRPLQVAIMGRPNAGKSTLVNRILGEDKMLTGPEAGITRDAIGTVHDWDGTPVRLFDTAGMRRKAKVVDKLEKLSVADAIRAIKFSEVVVVLLDSQNPLETQDLRLADLAEREGRAVVIAVNKWDLVAEKQRELAALKISVERLLPQLRGVPFVTLSALDGKNVDRLHRAVLKAREVWNARISTARLNRWLDRMVQRHPPPAPGGRRIRIRYMTQIKTRPPTFILFVSKPEDLPADYLRYLTNGLREEFGLEGTPIRMQMRKGEFQSVHKPATVTLS